jgi:hypothetical protein
LAASALIWLSGVSLWAQQRQDIVISVPPVTGQGRSPDDILYFTDMTIMEVGSRGYSLGEHGSDYILAGSVSRADTEDEGTKPPVPEDDWYAFHIELIEAETGRKILEQDLNYQHTEKVNEFFPLLIFNMLANIPLTKLAVDDSGNGSPEYMYISPDPPPGPPQHWLYLGLRAGTSLRVYKRSTAEPFIEKDVHHYYNINAALQLTWQMVSFMGIQAEGIFSNDYAPYEIYETNAAHSVLTLRSEPFTAYSLMFPLTLKCTLRKEPLLAAALGGVYLAVPLGNMQNGVYGGSFPYSFTVPVGYTVGINLGMKAGPGYLFLDLRWAQDLGETIKTESMESLYRRSMVILALGYEIGLFRRVTGTAVKSAGAGPVSVPPRR